MTALSRASLASRSALLALALMLAGCSPVPPEGGAVGLGAGGFFFIGAIAPGTNAAKQDVLAVDTGADLQLQLGETTTLLGVVSGGRPPYSFFWDVVGGPNQTLRDQRAPVLTVTATNLGNTQFRLTVTDFNGATATSYVTVGVSPAQLPTGLLLGPG